jgi:tetratricopeptide (TPR) repeat protein
LKEKIEQAAALFGAGRPREALEVLQEVTSAAPGMMRAQTLSARCWLSLGHRDKALEHLGIAATTAERAPDPAAVIANLTQFHVLAGDHEGALRLIERAISMRPGDMNLRLRHANLLCGAERWRDALVIFEAAVKKLPDNASLLKSTGIAAQMSGQLTRASELYIRALAQGTVDRDVYSNLIAALIELGRIDEAHRHASAWLQALPADIEAMAFPCLARGGMRQCLRGVEVVRLRPLRQGSHGDAT